MRLRHDIGKRIADRRAELGLAQQELAAQLGIPRSQITSWETGRNRIHADDLPWLARHLHTSVSILMGTDLPGPTEAFVARIASLPAEEQELILRIVEKFERGKS